MSPAEPLPLLVRYRYLVLAALGLVVLVPFLGWRDLWYPDEPDVGEVCRAMFLSGDWIAPRRNGVIWVDYPPMVTWAGSLSSHLLEGSRSSPCGCRPRWRRSCWRC